MRISDWSSDVCSSDLLLLTPDEMAAADAAASASGLDPFGLMEKAGQAVAAAALRHYPQTQRFVVLCGPGNNGGNGYVARSEERRVGKGVSVRVDSGGGRFSKKKTK